MKNIKFKVGDIISWAWQDHPRSPWKIVTIYKQDKDRVEGEIEALGKDHAPEFPSGQVVKWTIHKEHVTRIPKLRYELLK